MSFNPRNMSPAAQQQMVRYQQISQSLDAVIQKKAQLESQLKQATFAIEELEKAGEDATVFRSIGGIFIKSDQEKLLKDTQDEKETLEMRKKSVNTQEERLRKQHEDLTKKIKEIMGNPDQ